MTRQLAKIQAVNGNMVIAVFQGDIMLNEVAYVLTKGRRLKAEVIKITEQLAYLQVFENTEGIKVGDGVEFSEHLLSVRLGPGLLGRIYDGLQNPLTDLAKEHGFFLPAGVEANPLSMTTEWPFTASVKIGDTVIAGDCLGTVPEGIFTHRIFVPFNQRGSWKVETIKPSSKLKISDKLAILTNVKGEKVEITLSFNWPVKIPITNYAEKLMPTEQLITQARVIDTFFPIAKGGTFCIPGPFGAGKTVLDRKSTRLNSSH